VKAPERDYSHRSLGDKLGVVAQARAALVGRHDPWFVDTLNARLTKPPAIRLRATYDLIFLRVDGPRDLAAIAPAANRLAPDGALWIVHPKGRGALPRDAEVRAAALAAGLVDNKISTYGDTHTTTRYVVPVVRRKSHAASTNRRT
jgi:hypothetical protein